MKAESEGFQITRLSSQMGIFLQKTNIIRDYYEDLINGRSWWPEELWGAFIPENQPKKLSIFLTKDSNRIMCLNALICNALSHGTTSLRYLKNITNKDIFRFCEIPQVMAIKTLELLYSNSNVFIKNIKISKLSAIHCIIEATNFSKVKKIFGQKWTFLSTFLKSKKSKFFMWSDPPKMVVIWDFIIFKFALEICKRPQMSS